MHSILKGPDPREMSLIVDGESVQETRQRTVVHRMITDLKSWIPVMIDFTEIDHEHNARTLSRFISEYPELSFLLRPLLYWDPEHASGTIHFERNDNEVSARTILYPRMRGEAKKELVNRLSFDLFHKLVRLTYPIANFATDGGDRPLNFI